MNKYCNNCFYWVNRKEENPNESNCDKCKSNPYNKYEGVVLKCRNEKEFKLAQEFFINRGIPVGINKFIDMYPCYIGIDEHQVKSRFSFTTFKVFYNKNIIWGESNYKNEFVTWIGYKYMTIDDYLSTTVKSEKEDLLDKKEITINTNSSVVGYIAGYVKTGENNISCYKKNKSESPYEKWNNKFIKVRNTEEWKIISKWWCENLELYRHIFVSPNIYPIYMGVANNKFVDCASQGFIDTAKKINKDIRLILLIADDETGDIIYNNLNNKSEDDSKKETKVEIPITGGIHCNMQLTGGYTTNMGHVTGNQTTYVSPGNFYTMSTEGKLNYLYNLILNK